MEYIEIFAAKEIEDHFDGNLALRKRLQKCGTMEEAAKFLEQQFQLNDFTGAIIESIEDLYPEEHADDYADLLGFEKLLRKLLRENFAKRGLRLWENGRTKTCPHCGKVIKQ